MLSDIRSGAGNVDDGAESSQLPDGSGGGGGGPELRGRDFGYAVVLYVCLNLIRAASIAIMRCGRGGA